MVLTGMRTAGHAALAPVQPLLRAFEQWLLCIFFISPKIREENLRLRIPSTRACMRARRYGQAPSADETSNAAEKCE